MYVVVVRTYSVLTYLVTGVALGRDDVVKGGVNQSHGLDVLSRRIAKIFRAGFQDFRVPEEGRAGRARSPGRLKG